MWTRRGWVTACTELGGRLSLVKPFVGHPLASPATPLSLAISKKRVDRMAIHEHDCREHEVPPHPCYAFGGLCCPSPYEIT
jgi:hypothetical protein